MSNKSALPRVLIALVVLLLCIAFAWKTVRYMNPPQRSTTTFDQRLVDFLGQSGWQQQEPSSDTKNKAVQIFKFNKIGCTQPLNISIVGRTSGLESYLRQKFGDDIAFVQHGDVLEHPSLLRHQIASTWNKLHAQMTGQPEERQPILAVTPAPRRTPQDCQGPTQEQWHSF